MKTLKLSDEQFATIEKMLEYEWKQELTFQAESKNPDTSLLKEYLELYKTIIAYKYERASFVDVLVATELINLKEIEMKRL